ncbi:uncharacterized protein LOC135344787 [Halichondria panicea]|uniref:uncharacterized protein LOC135344787 n=1 Tax=Halichondria panicea TaxID=6063 RepID=UPI00312B6B18
MAGIEVDGLEYDAEVAYITATSPVPVEPGNKESRSSSISEFEFSGGHDEMTMKYTANDTKLSSEEQAERSESAPKPMDTPENPKLAKESTTKEQSKTKQKHPVPSLVLTSPMHSTSSDTNLQILTPPHYTLDTSLPSTPKFKLMRIQEAQASPPSPKTSNKFQTKLNSALYNYRTVVIYGHAGCGKTNLVEKLVHSNPAMFAKVVSNTTRKKRADEVDGIDFNFISQKQMSLGMARGDYLEYVQLQKRPKKRMQRAATSDVDMIMKTAKRRSTAVDFPTDLPTLLEQPQRTSSKFDLLAEDSPIVSGEFIGTTKQALAEATQLAKPCVVLNVTMTGAQQFKKNGTKATYILIHSGTKPPKQGGVKPDFTVNADQPNEAYKQLHQCVMQLVEDLQLTQTTRYEITKHEWDSLPTVKLETSTDATGPQANVRPVTFSEVLTHFQSINFRKERELAKEEIPKEGAFSRNKLDKKLRDERLLVLAMARCSLDKNKLHLRILQTIYIRLTGRNINCRRYGAHWTAIGFSGSDPADDLEGVGMFGLAQLIYLLDNNISLAREIFRYTKQETPTIPFCNLSFQVTQIALSALRGSFLTKLANKREQVFVIINDFYTATFYHYYMMWKSHGMAMLDSSTLIQSVSDYACKHARDVLKNYHDYQSKKENSRQAPSDLIETAPKPFTPLEDYSDV